MRALPITGEYPADWKAISDRVWADAGHRCIRCAHPYRKGEHGKGEWSPCDADCKHYGPLGALMGDSVVPLGDMMGSAGHHFTKGIRIYAQWRIGTVHHLDGNKANCVWWNLLALCQRCHLTIQSRVNPEQPYIYEHDEWFKPYAAGFYAKKYHGQEISREEATARLEELLAIERLA